MLGLSLSNFTLLHVAISLVAIASGVVVMWGMLRGERLDGWTSLFLLTTLLTSVTGFMFPFQQFLPSHAFGFISLLLLVPTLLGRYAFAMRKAWRWIYIVGAVVLLYLNVFVLVVQIFLKIPAINALAPTQAEPPFAIAQGVTLLVFLLLGFLSTKRFHPL
jgi:hypothetical protein